MDQFENWYSIIRYSPNNVRGETINVGIILFNAEIGEFQIETLKHTNSKLRSLLPTQKELSVYKLHTDFINHYSKTFLTDITNYKDKLNQDFFEEFINNMPKEITFSEPTHANFDSENQEKLLKKLLELYIGKYFLQNTEVTSAKIKNYVRNSFIEEDILETKVKANARIHPIPNKDFISANIDFVYKNGVLNFMQVAPSKENMTNWFNKINTVIDNYDKETKYHIFLDESFNRSDEDFLEMMNFLEEKLTRTRLNVIDIHSPKFKRLCKKIKLEGQDVDSFSKELSHSS